MDWSVSQRFWELETYQTFRGVPDANILELELRKGALARVVAHVARASSEHSAIPYYMRPLKVRGHHLRVDCALLLDESLES